MRSALLLSFIAAMLVANWLIEQKPAVQTSRSDIVYRSCELQLGEETLVDLHDRVSAVLTDKDSTVQAMVFALLAVEMANRGPVRRQVEVAMVRLAYHLPGVTENTLAKRSLGIAQIQLGHVLRRDRSLSLLQAIEQLNDEKTSMQLAAGLVEEWCRENQFLLPQDISALATCYNSGTDTTYKSAYSLYPEVVEAFYWRYLSQIGEGR